MSFPFYVNHSGKITREQFMQPSVLVLFAALPAFAASMELNRHFRPALSGKCVQRNSCYKMWFRALEQILRQS